MKAKHFLVVTAVWVLSTVSANAQGVSAKDLREKLGADVKRFGNDGRLQVVWTFKDQDAMRAFKAASPDSVSISDRGGIEMKSSGASRAGIELRELRFQAPFKMSLEFELGSRADGLFVELESGVEPGRSTLGFVHWQPNAESSARFCGAFHVFDGKPAHAQEYPRSEMDTGETHQVSFAVVKDTLEMTLGTTVLASLPYSHKNFGLRVLVRNGTFVLKKLEIDSMVVLESARKLAKSSEAVRAKEEASEEPAVSPFRRLAEERSKKPPSKASLDELEGLTEREQKTFLDAVAAWKQRKTERAKNLLDELTRSAPKAAHVFYQLGSMQGLTGERVRALRSLEAAVKIREVFPEAWLELGELKASLGFYDEAFECLKKAEAQAAHDAFVHVARLQLYLELGKLPEALAELAAAREKRPTSKGLDALSASLERLNSTPKWAKVHRKLGKDYAIESDISEKLCAEMSTKLVRYRRFLEKAFPLPAKQTAPCRVWIFDSEGEYHLFASSFEHGAERTLGLYHPTIKTLLLIGKTNVEDTTDVLFHEAFHQYLDLAVPRAPLWFNEGLAEYFGATDFDRDGRGLEGGIQRRRLNDLKAHLGRDGLVPFASIMQMSRNEFMSEAAPIHYAQSWAMVHFFRRTNLRGGSDLFRKYTERLISGSSPAGAYDESFGQESVSLADLQSAFEEHLNSLR